ncbi:group II intron reverse transcriptase/maturase [Spirochaetota bacterium]
MKTGKPVGGKEPCFDNTCRGGKREGMTEKSNNPKNKVQELQRKLWTSAKRSKTRRFHALYDRLYRGDVLVEAWKRVKANKGAAGVDKQTIAEIEDNGAGDFLERIQADLKSGRYRPLPVRRRYIPKGNGKQRPLGIPTVRDRVVQMAAKLVIEPIFEADFRKHSYGFRPGRSATQAMEAIREAGNQGYNIVIDADIKGYFDAIDQRKLMILLKERISDRRMLKLIRKWLEAGVMEDGTVRRTLAGTPQGGVISPLLANIYLNVLDRVWENRCKHLGILIRYADDFVIMCRRTYQVSTVFKFIRAIMDRMGLELHPEKTRTVDLRWGKEAFNFLGWTVRKRRSIQRNPRLWFMQRWPAPRAMIKLRERIHSLTRVRGNPSRSVEEVIKKLNPVLRGWANYFKTGNSDDKYNAIDSYTWQRIVKWQRRRGGQRTRYQVRRWPPERLWKLGLYQLQGTVNYPVHALS